MVSMRAYAPVRGSNAREEMGAISGQYGSERQAGVQLEVLVAVRSGVDREHLPPAARAMGTSWKTTSEPSARPRAGNV